MKPAYRPKSIGGKLGHLAEECNEVAEAIDKTLRLTFEVIEQDPPLGRTACLLWALDGGNPELPIEQRETNRDWILREIADLELALASAKKGLAP